MSGTIEGNSSRSSGSIAAKGSGITTSSGDPAIDTNPSSLGTMFVNTTSGETYVCTNITAGENVWKNVGDGTGDIEPFHGSGENYGYISCGGGRSSSYMIEKFSFTSDGNAVDAGQDSTYNGSEVGGCSSSTYGYVARNTCNIRKYQFNTSNDMASVGNLSTTTTARNQVTGTMSPTYGYWMGGGEPTELDVIDKNSFSSDGDASDVGNLTQARRYASGHCSKTYGYAAGGMQAPPNYNIIDKWSFSSDGNASDVGDLTRTLGYIGGGVQSLTYGYSCGGSSPFSNIIDKFSFSSDGNATDVGDLTQATGSKGDATSTTHGYRVGGSSFNTIDKWSLTSDGNATDVGDVVAVSGYEGHACSQY